MVELHRFEYGTDYIVGKLYIDGIYECYTLEKKDRPEPGTYPFLIDTSTIPYLVTPQHEILVGKYWYGIDKLKGIEVAGKTLQKDLQEQQSPPLLSIS